MTNPTNPRVAYVLDATADAYMADVYGEDGMRGVALFLLAEGLNVHQAIEFMRSKHMRWADDQFGRGADRKASAQAVRMYVNRKGNEWLRREARELVEAANAAPFDEDRAMGAL